MNDDKKNINLKEGVYLQIGGELGRNNSLPIDSLIQIAKSFQKLVLAIAEFEGDGQGVINLDNFKIELSDFKHGSAVPQFRYVRSVQMVVEGDPEVQREYVDSRLTNLFDIANKGTFTSLKTTYPHAHARNEIVRPLNDFLSAAGDSPMKIVSYNKEGGFDQLFQLRKLKDPIFRDLIINIKKPAKKKSEEDKRLAWVSFPKGKEGDKRSYKVGETFGIEKHSLDFSPDVIVSDSTVYTLRYPLRCKLEEEDGFVTIESEMLDLIGVGEDLDLAEQDFSENFDYAYYRYNELEDSKLSNRILLIRNLLNEIVTLAEPRDA